MDPVTRLYVPELSLFLGYGYARPFFLLEKSLGAGDLCHELSYELLLGN